jgi:hypothetical protein
MPQRSNDFQYLVELIHRLYAPQGAIVTPSAMVEPTVGGDAREVDVLVEYQTNLYPVKIAIEAKDRSRPIDVTGIEQYIGKYNSNGGIVVDKVIIVAKSFSESARKKAKLFGFNLHTINDLEDGNVKAFFMPESEGGCWCISKKVGKKVDVKLVDKNGHNLPLHSVITPRNSNTNLGTALMWAERAIKHDIGRLADAQYKIHAGEMLCIMIELQFRNHKARIHSKSYRLGKMIFDFGWMMRIPPMKAEKFELIGDSGELKTIIRESGGKADEKISIIYEENKDTTSPNSFFLDQQSKKNKKLVIKLDV